MGSLSDNENEDNENHDESIDITTHNEDKKASIKVEEIKIENLNTQSNYFYFKITHQDISENNQNSNNSNNSNLKKKHFLQPILNQKAKSNTTKKEIVKSDLSISKIKDRKSLRQLNRPIYKEINEDSEEDRLSRKGCYFSNVKPEVQSTAIQKTHQS